MTLSEESVVKHFYNFGDHRCKRGHSYRIKFEENKEGITSGYIKVCRRCGKDEVRELGHHGNRVVSSRSEDSSKVIRSDESNGEMSGD